MSELHKSGPYKIINDNITCNGNIVQSPAVIIDIDSDGECALLKHGDQHTLAEKYNSMLAELNSKPETKAYASDLNLIIFDLGNLSKDSICTALNAVINCTGDSILKALVNVNSDIELFNSEIAKLQKLGY